MSEEPALAAWLREQMPRKGYPVGGPRSGGISRLAENAGLPQATISRLVNGKAEPSVDTLRKIGNVLGYGLGQMLVHAGWASPEEVVRGIDVETGDLVEPVNPLEGIDLPPGFDPASLPRAVVEIYGIHDTPLNVRELLVQTWRLAMGDPVPGLQHVVPTKSPGATERNRSAAS